MKEVAILGIGMHPWGKWPEKKFVEYAKVVGAPTAPSRMPA